MMESNKSDRRQFLKQAAVGLAGGAAGLAAGAGWQAKGQTVASAEGSGVRGLPGDSIGLQTHVHGEPPRRGARYSLDHLTHYTPLQDYQGIITPAPVHFVQQHSAEFPDIDASEHRLTIHGLVDRPLSFSMDDLKRLPSVARVHFVECHGNSSPASHNRNQPANVGLPVQYIHGMASTSEWSGVPFSVLLNEAGLKKEGTWLVMEGGDQGKFSHTLPVGKALDDCFVAYGQNGEPLRREQGYPIRAIVPGWEGPHNVKYLKHIKVVDEPYNTWNESMNHSVSRPDIGGKARWYHFQWGPKSIITRPSGGMEMRKGYVQITGLAWSGAGRVSKVDVSTDGGKTWKEAVIQGPVHSKAHTRFTFDWAWNGQEAMLMSRCTDETGDVQPSIAELTEHWGFKMEDWHKPERPRAIHMNAIQPWYVAKDGSITDAMFA
jgi:sulfane dehydrogenase subunit SoxC